VQLSSTFRALIKEDIFCEVDQTKPFQVLVGVELSGFEGNDNEEALLHGTQIGKNRARIFYRFRPKRKIREAISNKTLKRPLDLEDFAWELLGGVAKKYRALHERILAAGACADGIYSWMSGTHLLEASATAVQLDTTYDIFGDEGLNILWALIEDSPNAKKYVWLLNDILESLSMEGVRQLGVGGVVCYFIWVALQGNECRFDGSIKEPSEVAYFSALASQRVGHDAEKFNLEWAQRRVGEFNREWGFSDLETILKRRTEDLDRLQKKIATIWTPEPALRDHLLEIFGSLGHSYHVLQKYISTSPQLYFGGRIYSWALLSGNMPSLRVEFKVNDKRYVTFTRGMQSIPPKIWDTIVAYSTTLRLLFEGRTATELPDTEDDVFNFLKSEGLKFKDVGDVFNFAK
jgi:hypothetical protein